MKIDINLTGPAAPVDFDLLKAALVAAQAATPTARASRGEPGAAQAGAAPAAVPTFADLLRDEQAAAVLAHRFAADADGMQP